jgi:hypothetical protein
MLQFEPKTKRKVTLLTCIFFSLVLHTLAITVLQKHSLWFYSERKASSSLVKTTQSSVKKYELSLKSGPTKKRSSPEFLPSPSMEAGKEICFPMKQLEVEEPLFALQKKLSAFRENDPTHHFVEEMIPTLSSYQTLPDLHPELLDNISYPFTFTAKDSVQEKLTSLIAENEKETNLQSFYLSMPQEEEPASTFASAANEENLLHKEESSPLFSEEDPNVSSLGKIPTLGELGTASLGDKFDVELVYYPQKNAEGYIFTLTLIPRQDFDFPKLNHNFYFLIDKANAIQKNRLKTSINAINRAIGLLGENDKFNVIAYDTKWERMALENLPTNRDSKTQAKKFLTGIQLGSFFASADPYKPLQTLLYENIPADELATVILITNGEGISNQNKQSYFIHQWTNQNSGRFSLYSLAMSEDKNIAILDLMSSLNKGKLYTTPTFQGIKRRLLKMVKSLRFPIAKDLACSVISRNPDTQIHLYPSYQQMPSLFADQPFVIMGVTKNLDDFILFMQGKQKDGWLNIKKNISFANAKEGNSSLELQWDIVKSQNLFERYLREGNPQLLIDAHSLLEKHHLPIAF